MPTKKHIPKARRRQKRAMKPPQRRMRVADLQRSVDSVSKRRPITRKIVRIGDEEHTGWSLYKEDYERAVTAMGDVIYDDVLTSGDAPANCARKALAAIGIQMP